MNNFQPTLREIAENYRTSCQHHVKVMADGILLLLDERERLIKENMPKDLITLHKIDVHSTGVSYASKQVEIINGKAFWEHDFVIPLDSIGNVAGGPFYGFAFTKEQAFDLEAQKVKTMMLKAQKELKHVRTLDEKLREFEEKG